MVNHMIQLKADQQESASEFYYQMKLQPASSQYVAHMFDTTVSHPNSCQAHQSKKLALDDSVPYNILLHSLGQAVQENIRFPASVLALPMIGPILPALN